MRPPRTRMERKERGVKAKWQFLIRHLNLQDPTRISVPRRPHFLVNGNNSEASLPKNLFSQTTKIRLNSATLPFAEVDRWRTMTVLWCILRKVASGKRKGKTLILFQWLLQKRKTMIDHESRKRLILDKALELFVERGYADVTFQNIAERCGVSRTTIYKYFENKRRIFSFAILQLMNELDEPFRRVAKDESTPIVQKLRQVMRDVVYLLLKQTPLLKVVMDYLLLEKQTGSDIQRKIERHTVGIRLLLDRLVEQGAEKGEFSPEKGRVVSGLLYSLFESTILRLILLEEVNPGEIGEEVDYLLKTLNSPL